MSSFLFVAPHKCRGCAWGPTPDEGTAEQALDLRLRASRATAKDHDCEVHIICHRAEFLDRVARMLHGDEIRRPTILCRGACDEFGAPPDAATYGKVAFRDLDGRVDRAVRLNLYSGPET